MAAHAVKSYDPAKGNLKQHVYGYLQGLKRTIPSINDPLAPPERFARDLAAMQSAEGTLTDRLGRAPTDEELAEEIGVTPARITRIRKRARPRVPMSTIERSGGDDGDDVNDVTVTMSDPYDDWMDAVYHDLPPVDKIILQHRSGYRGADKLTLAEVAKKVNLSPQAVAQRAARIQARLDEFNG